VQPLLEEARLADATLDATALGILLTANIERLAEQLLAQPDDVSLMERLNKAASLVQALPFEVNLWKTQNICYKILHTCCSDFKEKASSGEEDASSWIHNATVLAENFRIQLPSWLL